ncbi:cell cycle sensor histidine kinase DivJ [soil metagenome]
MTEAPAEIDLDDAPPHGADDDARGVDRLIASPKAWAMAWVATLGLAAVLLLTGDPNRPPWAPMGALLLAALAVLGGLGATWALSRPVGLVRGPATRHPDAEAIPTAPVPTIVGAPLPPVPAWAAMPADTGAAAELARFETLMGDLPELALLLAEGDRAEVVFGRPLAGVSTDALHAGLLSLVAETDREAVGAALTAARAGHAGQGFALASDPARRLRLSAKPTAAGGVAAMLLEAPEPPPQPVPAVTSPVPPAAFLGASLAAPVRSQGAAAAPDPDAAISKANAERDAALAESASKSRFLANMSHELRTPLNAILGFSDIMRTRLFGPLSDRYAEYAELIHESGRHLTYLINYVRDMSKLDADRYVLQREAFDAREPVQAALKLMQLQAQDKGVELRASLSAEPLKVDADRRALKQIAINLVSNALKFTPAGGRVDVRLQAASGELELAVSDTGVGIAQEDLARLGRPFEQTDAGRRVEGTGLGLALVKALTGLHGGDFQLESRLGEGATATVRLPVLLAVEAA